VIEKRYNGTLQHAFQQGEDHLEIRRHGPLIEETRDAESTPGNGSDDFLTRDTIAGGDFADSCFQPRSMPENRW
jgi:hypothetical protein